MDKELREILKPWGQVCYTGYVDPANVISAITKLFKERMLELIGDNDEVEPNWEGISQRARNDLRAELRKKVEVDNG
jgi:hypothetical protein